MKSPITSRTACSDQVHMSRVCRIAFCLLSVLACSPSLAGIYTFKEYIVPLEAVSPSDEASTVISESGYVLAGGHYPASFCSEGSPYYCIESAPFTFVVPKYSIDVGDAWSHEGAEFSVAKEYKELSIMGLRTQAFLIVRNLDDEVRLLFLYSPCRGLLAFGSEVLGTSQLGFISWIVGDRGPFGAVECEL